MWILDKFIQVVSEVTEVSVKDIVSRSRQEDIVLARKVFVNICLKYGISTRQIAETLHRSKEGIRRFYVQSISDESRKIYQIFYQQTDKKIKELNFNNTVETA